MAAFFVAICTFIASKTDSVMIAFKPVEIEDKDLMMRYFHLVNYRNCDFSFATVFCWSYKYKTSFAIVDDFMLVRFLCDDGLPCYMMPIGEGDMSSILKKIIADCSERGDRFRIHAITLEMFNVLDKALPNTFSFEECRDYFEYLYLAQDLVQLSGKKFQPKRNHINQFKRLYPNYRYEQLTPALIPQCLSLYAIWAQNYMDKYPEADLKDEESSVRFAFDYFEQLELRGGCLFVDKQMVAFTFGEQITADTFAIHAEKALHDVHGAFPMINQQFAQHEAANFTYINREEDLGIESLRQAKMSYHPVQFLRRGSVYLKSENI